MGDFPIGYFTCVLRTHSKEVLDVFIIYPVIKNNVVILANKIWISIGMNGVNNDIDQSKDIYSCLQADKYMYKPLTISSSVIELQGYMYLVKTALRRSSLEHVYFYLVG